MEVVICLLVFLVLGVGFSYAIYYDKKKRVKLLENQAIKRNGTLQGGSLCSDPRLFFPHYDVEFTVSYEKMSAGRKYYTDTFIEAQFPLALSFYAIIQKKIRFLTIRYNYPLRQIGNPDFDNKIMIESKNDENLIRNLITPEIQNKLLDKDFKGSISIATIVRKFRFSYLMPTNDQGYDWLLDTAIMFYDRLKELG
jgi:hypothetical protein